jgi:small subunit ribosomal protein S20
VPFEPEGTSVGVDFPKHESISCMANIKSQMKRNRQNEKRNQRNKAVRSELKTRTKAALAAAESGDAGAAQEELRLAQQRIDTAVSKGVLHKNTAARRKARLVRRVTELIGS